MSGLVMVSICDATFDTMLELYPGDCGTTSPSQCSDDACYLGSSFYFYASAGESRLIRLGAFWSSTGTGTLEIIDSENGPLGHPICLAEPNPTGTDDGAPDDHAVTAHLQSLEAERWPRRVAA